MKKHALTLLGSGSAEGLRVPAHVLVEAIGALVEGARRTIRFVCEGESVRSGPYPGTLSQAAHVDVTGLAPGSTVVSLEAAASEPSPSWLFEHIPIGEDGLPAEDGSDLELQYSAIDLFAHVLALAARGDRDRLDADRALLDACARFARAGGVAGVRLDGIAAPGRSLTVRAADAETIELIRDETPPPRAARVTGVLDTVSATTPEIVLRLPQDKKVRAWLGNPDAELLRRLFNTRVVISGRAQFRPSGQLRVLSAEYIGPASAEDALWETVPTARADPASPTVRMAPQDDNTGVSAFFGTWPGDETEGELLDALEAVG